MTDFKNKFKIGIEAFKDAEKNRSEIREVFSELNEQLSEIAEGKVQIKIYDYPSENIAGAAKAALMLSGAKISYDRWIVAVHAIDNSKRFKLARWFEDVSGYPCAVSAQSERWDAYDRAALEEILGRLLTLPETGRVMVELRNHQIPAQKT